MSETSTTGERLGKRIATLRGCSRSDAERLIEGGWVRVDGTVVTEPAHRVQPTQVLAVDPQAQPLQLVPVTLAWHKPTGVALQEDQPLAGLVEPARGLLHWHVKHLRCASPMPATSSGLAVFAQSAGVLRMLRENGPLLEHEWMLDVEGAASATQMQTLLEHSNRLGPNAWIKLSVSSQNPQRTRLRLAAKGYNPASLPDWLISAGLAPLTLYRLRIGRVALGPLPEAAWRTLSTHERL
jgi:23S rRNA pseudouridine2604 synthase